MFRNGDIVKKTLLAAYCFLNAISAIAQDSKKQITYIQEHGDTCIDDNTGVHHRKRFAPMQVAVCQPVKLCRHNSYNNSDTSDF